MTMIFFDRQREDQKDLEPRDKTGQEFTGTPVQKPGGAGRNRYVDEPQILECPNCKTITFYIVGEGPLVQFQCAGRGCETVWPVVQITLPQARNDRLLKKLDLWLPESYRRRRAGSVVPVEMEVDIEWEDRR